MPPRREPGFHKPVRHSLRAVADYTRFPAVGAVAIFIEFGGAAIRAGGRAFRGSRIKAFPVDLGGVDEVTFVAGVFARWGDSSPDSDPGSTVCPGSGFRSLILVAARGRNGATAGRHRYSSASSTTLLLSPILSTPTSASADSPTGNSPFPNVRFAFIGGR